MKCNESGTISILTYGRVSWWEGTASNDVSGLVSTKDRFPRCGEQLVSSFRIAGDRLDTILLSFAASLSKDSVCCTDCELTMLTLQR